MQTLLGVQRVEQIELESDQLGFLLDEIDQSFWVDWDELRELGLMEPDTVGEFFDAVIRRMDRLHATRCLSSLAFYRLRRSLLDLADFDRKSVRPAMPLRGALSPKLRAAWWDEIEIKLGLRVPRLELGKAALALYVSSVGLAVIAGILFSGGFVTSEQTLLVLLGMPFLIRLLWKTASRLPREIPAETFGDLVRSVVTLNQAKLAEEAGGFTRKEAWSAFRELLSRETGVPAESITCDLRFLTNPS